MRIRICFIAIIILGCIAFAIFYFLNRDCDSRSFKEKFEPYISDYIDLNFPGQYACIIGDESRGDEVRYENYWLSDEEQQHAIEKLKLTLENTEEITVDIYVWKSGRTQTTFSPPNAQNVAKELSQQLISVKRSRIPPMSVYGDGPDVVFTLYPSEIKLSLMSYITNRPFIYVSLGEGPQRWEANFGDNFIDALLEVPIQGGETVRSALLREINEDGSK